METENLLGGSLGMRSRSATQATPAKNALSRLLKRLAGLYGEKSRFHSKPQLTGEQTAQACAMACLQKVPRDHHRRHRTGRVPRHQMASMGSIHQRISLESKRHKAWSTFPSEWIMCRSVVAWWLVWAGGRFYSLFRKTLYRLKHYPEIQSCSPMQSI
jgi:hypothetical protein